MLVSIKGKMFYKIYDATRDFSLSCQPLKNCDEMVIAVAGMFLMMERGW